MLLALVAVLRPGPLAAQGTAFTYQGSLSSAGHPANGWFDLTLAVWDASTSGNLWGGPITNTGVAVSNGLFTITLDFGPGVFTGPARWLEIGVRSNGVGNFSALAPRQAATPAPYAIMSANALSAASAATAAAVTGSVAAGQITGTLSSANIGAGTISATDLAPNTAAANLNAGGLSGVASSGLVLSTTDNNTNLANAGYVKIYGSFGTPDAWQAFTNAPVTGPPSARNSHTAVWTGSEMIVWGGYGGTYLNDGGRYNPAVDTWTALPVTAGGTPAGRLNHTAVWTGGAMVVWGGVGSSTLFNDGGAYDPVLNAWNYLPGSLPNAPAARLHHTAVWTGSAMIVWGGQGSAGDLNDGGLYNPGLNSWTSLPANLANAPGAREQHTAVWSGSEMIVWGGAGGSGVLNDGGRYNPANSTWVYLPNTLGNVPGGRASHTAVWTGTNMIVWGGSGAAGDLNDGGGYDPVANSWGYLPASLGGTPGARESHTVVWTGTEMMVWGGYSDAIGTLVDDGARYNPALNSWIYVPGSLAGTPPARYEHTAVWTGTEMIVWGGGGVTGELNDGGRYNPSTGVWIYLAGTAGNVPPPREYHTAVWTGTQMLVWGGVNNGGFLNDGGGYNPTADVWTYLPGTAPNAPGPREAHTAVWTGTNMIVWGGAGTNGFANDGGLFDPLANAWTYLPGTLANAPAVRAGHAAVWTGSQMLVWGGMSNAVPYADGGLFNPATTSWTYLPVNLPNTPAARSAATAVWTGSAMIVWGGNGGGGVSLGDGGMFAPASAAWTYLPAGQSGAPSARTGQSAVWTGLEMVIWGGGNNAIYYSDGGRYNPSLNTWTFLSATPAGTPLARANHTAVWTGSQMVVWGGAGAATYNDTAGYTPGRVLYLYQRP